ncbi:MAG TPA: crotonase/enoyl-CoA hydratase family protein [Acidimicrobiales bacterium]|nr:crotonase/enoyl-CoA hydratase family protein [Acidimicrobiales bacterium]
MGEQVVSLERRGAVATVWLDRAEARNAMGLAFFEQLPKTMAEVSEDRQVRAVVVVAKGSDFSVGLDLKAMGQVLTGSLSATTGDGDPDAPVAESAGARALSARPAIHRLQRSISSVADCPKPVIAAVHGYCIGGGINLASACDIRLASADAKFSVRETKVAIVCDLGALQRLPHIIGRGPLSELAYTGKDIDAHRAKDIGLVNEVLPDAEAVQTAALDMAEEIAANSPLAVQGTKAVLRAGEGRSVAEGLDYVATWNAGFLQSEDLVEAMTAFVEKRPPQFRGR